MTNLKPLPGLFQGGWFKLSLFVGGLSMGNPGIQELKEQAIRLRSLADHVAGLVDTAHNFTSTTMKSWSGPHADRTRAELKRWRHICERAAEELREEARALEKSATELRNDAKS